MRLSNSLLLQIRLILSGFVFHSLSATYGNASEVCKRYMLNPLKVGDVIETLYWSDADSGRANGVCFRYANKDAAETGPVGSWGGAKCEEERKTGYQAKNDMIALTRGRRIVVSDTHGFDRHYRQVVEYDVDGVDLGALAIDEGILHNWPFFRGRALKPKPDYCR